jgi:hypothetical protein
MTNEPENTVRKYLLTHGYDLDRDFSTKDVIEIMAGFIEYPVLLDIYRHKTRGHNAFRNWFNDKFKLEAEA